MNKICLNQIEESRLHGLITVMLTLKAPITTAADDIHKYFFHCFS